MLLAYELKCLEAQKQTFPGAFGLWMITSAFPNQFVSRRYFILFRTAWVVILGATISLSTYWWSSRMYRSVKGVEIAFSTFRSSWRLSSRLYERKSLVLGDFHFLHIKTYRVIYVWLVEVPQTLMLEIPFRPIIRLGFVPLMYPVRALGLSSSASPAEHLHVDERNAWGIDVKLLPLRKEV